MCQFSKTNQLVKTDKDIIVYKKLSITGLYDKNYILKSSFRKFEYKLNILYTVNKERILWTCTKYNPKYNPIFNRRIKGDWYQFQLGFHSFLSRRTAEKIINANNDVIAKCVIPKGSFIIRGFWDNPTVNAKQTIVSDMIIIKEIIYKNLIDELAKTKINQFINRYY